MPEVCHHLADLIYVTPYLLTPPPRDVSWGWTAGSISSILRNFHPVLHKIKNTFPRASGPLFLPTSPFKDENDHPVAAPRLYFRHRELLLCFVLEVYRWWGFCPWINSTVCVINAGNLGSETGGFSELRNLGEVSRWRHWGVPGQGAGVFTH